MTARVSTRRANKRATNSGPDRLELPAVPARVPNPPNHHPGTHGTEAAEMAELRKIGFQPNNHARWSANPTIIFNSHSTPITRS